jgi:hypothetical protein
VTGPLTAHRQRRRRITPNTNTTTTTMISTHNHVDMAASLVGAGAVQADATAGHPSKQLGHRQASCRARIDGRAPRRLAGPLHPATCPPIWAGPAADHAAPVVLSPSGHAQPAQPNHRPQHHTSGGPGQAATDPTRPQRADRRGWRGRAAFALLGWGEQCKHGCAETRWQMPRRRRRTDGARLRRHPNLRRGRLHRPALRYNPARCCAIHRGWDRQVVTRPRIRQQATVVGDCPGWLLGTVARLVVVGLLGRRPVPQVESRRPQPQQREAA